MKKINRCPWVGINKSEYEQYHDLEWGVSVYNDQILFEFLILEGAQAGLSWETILKRRADYKKVFCNFNPKKVAKLTDTYLEQQILNPRIIRNRLKIYSVRKNAEIFLDIQKEQGSFANYLGSFINHQKIINQWEKMSEVPVSTKESLALSKDLKKRGMSFVGPTIIYAYMQAVGMVNDHLVSCSAYKKCCQNKNCKSST